MKYLVPILLYFGLEPKRIAEICKINNFRVYHAVSVMKKQNTLEEAKSILAQIQFEATIKDKPKEEKG